MQGWLQQMQRGRLRRVAWQWQWCMLASGQLRGFARVDDLYAGLAPLLHFRVDGTEVLPPIANHPLWLVIRSRASAATITLAAPSIEARALWASRLREAAAGISPAPTGPAPQGSPQALTKPPLPDPFDDEDGSWGVPLNRRRRRLPLPWRRRAKRRLDAVVPPGSDASPDAGFPAMDGGE